MKLLKQLAVRIAGWITLREPEPLLSRAFAEANIALRNKQTTEMLRLANAELVLAKRQVSAHEQWSEQQKKEKYSEVSEALQMIGGGSWLPTGATITARTAESLRESGAPAGVVRCVEQLWDLELALEDRGWVRELNLSNFEFSLFGIHRIIALCRLYKIKNPLIRRGVELSGFYVFGRGFSVSCEDEDANQVLQDCLSAPENLAEFGHCGMVAKEEAMWTDGNIFLVYFRDKQTGALIFRTFDPIEIVQIVTDPDDASKEILFQRRWMSQVFSPASGTITPKAEEAWYPASGYEPADQPEVIGATNAPVYWDQPIIHHKAGGLAKWHWGVPLAYPAIDYARAFRTLIDNWCSIQAAMTRFAWQVETQGGIPAIAALKQSFATTLAIGDGGQPEQNPPPVTASTWISGPGNKLQMSKTSGMVDSPDVGRRVALMVYMVFGFPETMWGDASVGTLATASSLDRPTELKIADAQERSREFIQRIGKVILEESERAPEGKLSEVKRKTGKKFRDLEIKVAFPSILEHDIASQVNAIVSAMTLNGFEPTGIDTKLGIGMLMQELQVENWQEVLELMYPEDEYDDLMDRTPILAKQEDDALNPPLPAAPGTGGQTGVATPTPAKTAPGQPAAPQAPKPKSAKPRRTAAQQEAMVARAAAALNNAARLLEARRI